MNKKLTIEIIKKAIKIIEEQGKPYKKIDFGQGIIVMDAFGDIMKVSVNEETMKLIREIF